MAYDLHTHSKISDGTQTVAELVADVSHRGLTGFALTDHDTTAGWADAEKYAADYGVDFIAGMEISCAAAGVSVHLLSYLHDPTYRPLTDTIARVRQSRLIRAQTMVELLERDYPITWADVVRGVDENVTVGRPHIADTLVEAGVLTNRTEAFTGLLSPRSKYYVPHDALDPVRAVELVRAAGGVPVMAHPRARSRGRVAPDELIDSMIAAGLAGLEVYHRDNSDTDRRWLTRLAHEHGLLITGSSDYHGRGKPNRLGENTTHTGTVTRIRQLASGYRQTP